MTVATGGLRPVPRLLVDLFSSNVMTTTPVWPTSLRMPGRFMDSHRSSAFGPPHASSVTHPMPAVRHALTPLWAIWHMLGSTYVTAPKDSDPVKLVATSVVALGVLLGKSCMCALQ